MRSLIVTVGLLAACSDSGIGPDPDATSSSGNSMGGSDGDGGAPTAGSAPGGNGPTGGGVPGDDTQSGSRLKVKVRVGSDGSRSPGGWYDSQLNTDCVYRKTADGSRRCLPEGRVASHYLDDSCTQPVVTQSTCDPLQFALVSDDIDGCGDSWRAYPLAAAVTPATVYAKNGAGDCSSTTVPQGSLFATGAEMPASMFVSETIEIEP